LEKPQEFEDGDRRTVNPLIRPVFSRQMPGEKAFCNLKLIKSIRMIWGELDHDGFWLADWLELRRWVLVVDLGRL
jgi:hypothetical protein